MQIYIYKVFSINTFYKSYFQQVNIYNIYIYIHTHTQLPCASGIVTLANINLL